MGKLAFVFPGQGSQAVGMGKDLHDRFPEARAVFEAVDAALSERLSALCFEGPEESLRLTANTQPSILTVSAAAAAVLAARRDRARPRRGPLARRVLRARRGGRVRRRRGREGRACARHVHAGGGSGGPGRDERRARPRSGEGPGDLRRRRRGDRLGRLARELQRAGADGDRRRRRCGGAGGCAPQGGGCEARVAAPRVRALPLRAHGAGEGAARARAAVDRLGGAALPGGHERGGDAERGRRPDRAAARRAGDRAGPVDRGASRSRTAEGVTRVVEVGPGKVLSGLARRIDKSVEVWNVEDGASLEKTLAALAA